MQPTQRQGQARLAGPATGAFEERNYLRVGVSPYRGRAPALEVVPHVVPPIAGRLRVELAFFCIRCMAKGLSLLLGAALLDVHRPRPDLLLAHGLKRLIGRGRRD